jgi:LacI family repressor for deo operon, udp, cdd, tsx, nupC, and nupG
MLGDTGGIVDTEKKYMDIMLERMVDGIILVTPRMEDSAVLRYSKLIPLVVVDRRVRQYDVPQVWADNRKGAILAMEYLFGLGHRRIGFISGPVGVQGSVRREDGYRKTLVNHDIHFDPDLVARGDFLFESGYRSFEHFLRLKQPPTAVFSSNDIMAYGLIKRAMEEGIDIPRDLSIVGFDNISLSALINPPLTTVDHPVAEMGRGSMELLFCEMRLDKDYKKCIALENALVIRRSAVRITP